MEHRQIISNSQAGSTASRPSRMSTQVAGSQGSRFQPTGLERVEVTVIRAHNVPQFRSILGVKTEYFVTITYGATTKKTKKQTKKRTKSVQIDGQMVVWDQRLDAFFVQPSSRLLIRLYAKRLRINNILIGTHEVAIPVESNISVALGHGDGQAESTPPVTLDLTITVSTNGASPSDPQTMPTEGDDTPAEEVRQPTTRTDSRGPDQSTAPEHRLPPSDHQIGPPMPQDLETSLVEKARIDLDRVDEIEKSTDRSNTWEGVVGKIKWVMDKLSPVAELHPIALMTYKVLSMIPEELSKQYQRDNDVRNLVKTMHDAFDFANHEDTLISIRPGSKEAEILTRMLQDVSICSNFIQSYIGDSQFLMRMAKSMAGGVEDKVQQLSTAFVENKKAFLDQAVIATKITAFQILNDVGSISAKFDGVFTQLEWVSSQVSDAALDAKIEQIPYRTGSSFSPHKGCLPGTRTAFLDLIVDWVNNPASERSLVLFGQAGTGKSSIAHEIARRFNEMGLLTSSYIFIRKEQSKTEAYHLFTNLARNLADRYPLFKTALGRVVKDNTLLRLDTRDYGTLFRRLIQEPLKDLHIVGTITVVIDALDESGDTTSQDGLHRFLANHLSELPSNFRILITSRLEGDIGPAFLGAESVVIKYMNDDVLGATTHSDIFTFFQEKLDPADFEQYGSALARRAEGLFQWAAVAAGYIQEPKSVGRKRERIKHLLKLAADHHGQDPLNELYKGVLEAYFKNEEALFRFLVGQLLAAFEPLSIRSLTTLLRHATDDDNAPISILETLSQLGSLLSNVTSSDDTLPIVPLHTSFRDFVTNKEKSGDFYVDLRVAHRQLAHSCLGLALVDLKFNICKLESSYVSNKDVEDLESRIVKYLPPALSYACRFWDDHLKRLDFESDLFDKLQSFFKARFLHWLEALSLTGDVGLASVAFSSLRVWLAFGHGQVPEAELERLRSFINDASVFVRYFGMAVAKSAPHVYVSALPFAPRNSLVSTHYSSSFRRTLRVERGRLSNWLSSEMVISNAGRPVNCIALSPDGQRIVSGSSDGIIRVWNATTGDTEAFSWHTDSVTSVGFSPDGQRIVSGSHDQTIRVWNATTGDTEAGPFSGHTGWVTSVGFSPDGQRIVSGSSDRTIRVWNATTGDTESGPFSGHTDWVKSVGFSPDGQRIVSGSSDRTIRVWNAATGDTEAGPFSGHTRSVTSVGFSPDGQRIVSGSEDGTIRVWNATTGDTEVFSWHTGSVASVGFSPDGQRIVSGSYDRTIRVWNAMTGDSEAGPFWGHTHWVKSVGFSPDGQRIVSGSFDGTIRVWNATTGDMEEGPFSRDTYWVMSVGFSPDGQRIISGSRDQTIRVWNATTGDTEAGPFSGHTDWVTSVGFSPDGQWIVSGSSDRTIRVWNATTGDMEAGPFSGHTDSVTSVGFSPHGQRFVSGSSDRTIRVWNATTGDMEAGPFSGHTDSVMSVGFSPDGQRIISGSSDRTIRVWNATTGDTEAGPFSGHTDSVMSVGFSPDGQRIVSGSSDRTIRVWNAATGDAEAGPFSGHTASVWSVGFSPDGQRIVSGSRDQTIRVWNATTGDMEAGPFFGHTDSVMSVGFSPDGQRIVSSSEDGTIRVWNATTGDTESGPFFGHTDSVMSVGLLPDDQRIISSGEVDFTDQSVIDDDGWIRGDKGELLMWIPPAHRANLHRPRNIWVAGKHETRLDLSNFVHGRSWTTCIDPEEPL